MDVPEAQAGFRQWLALQGFVVERAFVRMYLGDATSRGDPGLQFAVAGPEFG